MQKEDIQKTKELNDIFAKVLAGGNLSEEEKMKVDKYIQEQGKQRNETLRGIGNDISRGQTWLGNQYVESIRALAIAAGALASFSIFLLSSEVVKSSVSLFLLVLGSILLLLVVILSFKHLFNRLSTDTIGLQSLRERTLIPLQANVSATVKYLMGKLSLDKWFEKEQDYLGGIDEEISQLEAESKSGNLSHFDEFLLRIFIVAVSLIIASLAFEGLISDIIESMISKSI